MAAVVFRKQPRHVGVVERAAEILEMSGLARKQVFAATPLFMGVASIKFKNGDMEAMGKNLGGAVCLFLVPKIVEVILAWAAQ